MAAVEYELIEIYDEDDVMDLHVDFYECTVTEVDAEVDDLNSGMILEELTASDAEEAEQASYKDFQDSCPEIEEPEDNAYAQRSPEIELFFNSEPIAFGPQVRADTSLQELFYLTRQSLDKVESGDELWFKIATLDLEVGEENVYLQEPTVGHLTRMLDPKDTLKVQVESRASFYSKFRDLMTALDIGAGGEGEAGPNKRIRRNAV